MNRARLAIWVTLFAAAVTAVLTGGPNRYGHSDRVERHMLPAVSTGPLDPAWSPEGLTRAGYEHALDQSLEEFSAVIATDNPDLSAFKARGGKIVMWHGQADPLIYPGGSIDYYRRVEKQMGGRGKTGDVLRFFLAPGVGHCGGGAGPNPSGQFEAMVAWVENGKAPKTLDAVRRDQSGLVTRTRPLCRYPLVAKYKGSGSTDEARNFTCASGF